MSARGVTIIAAATCLLGLVHGCQGVPPIPRSVRARGYTNDTPEEGRLFDRLMGRRAESPESEQESSSQVRPASAILPAAPAEGPTAPASVDPSTDERFKFEEDENSGFDWSDLEPANVYKNLKALAGYGPNEGVARALYEEGQELYRQGQYREAAGRFKAAADRWPDSTLEEDALFMAAESLFFSDQYPKATDTYEKLLKKYDYSRHLDTVVRRLFAIGRYWEQLHTADPHWPITPNLLDAGQPVFDTWGRAIKAYELVRMYDPTGPLADDAVMAAANAYFLKGRFEEAAYQYDLLRKEYPKSQHQVAAHLLGMKSKMSMYQGPMYDSTPLDEAGEIADQALLQFRGELGDQRQLVVQTKNRMVEEQAARDWAVAQYYDNKQCYGSARYYYRAIIDDYPHTAIAQQAKARLEEIKDFPDEPPNHFKWLTDLLDKQIEN